MFESLRQHFIFLDGSPIHNDQALQAMGHGWKMLQWMHEEVIQVARSRDWPDVPEQIYDPNIVAQRTKAHTLTLSYISILGTVEGVTKKFYERLVRVSAAQVNGIPLFAQPAIVDTRQMFMRAQEVENILKLRNKLTAHTSFADPRADSNSTQITSVFLMQPPLFNRTNPENYRIGGTLIMTGTETHNEFQNVYFSIYEDHPRMMVHFQEWVNMITAAFQHLGQQCPVYTPHRLLRRSDPPSPTTI